MDTNKSYHVSTDYPNKLNSNRSSIDGTETVIGVDSTPDFLGGNSRSYVGTYGETDGNAVDIDEALEEYQSVRRELTQQSRKQSVISAADLEKGDNNQEFDLTEFLSQQHSQLTAAGLKSKNMGVIWKNLKVEGLGADSRYISSNWSVVTSFLQFWKWGRHQGTDFTILNDNNGFCKPGEMLLVLGRPGAGCSTLLRVLANMRAAYVNIDGDVSYGGIDAREFGKYFKGEVCYNEEEDLHYPTLTTRQTLRFALKNKTPSTRIPGESKEQFTDKLLYMLGNMLGLTKQMNTMVGNAFVRGLSGGERKRLSIAEQMTTHSSINCWDCSTRGLDASSALDYVRSLRIMTDIMKKTTISTLYQASDSIFDLFDKVMVLDEGRCIYFGSTSDAKKYFTDMGFYCSPRKSTPDFLTGLCNLNEREVKPEFTGQVPVNSVQFEKLYKESATYAEMLQERDAYEKEINCDKPSETFKDAFKEAHNTPFAVSYFNQIKALTVRQFQLIWGDKNALITRYVDIIVKGIVCATVFYMMPRDGNGAFSRTGALSFFIIFNAFVAQSELPAFMEGRRILEKHKHFAMYHPSAFYLSQVIIDFPLSLLQALVFQLSVYFIMGLVLDAGKVS